MATKRDYEMSEPVEADDKPVITITKRVVIARVTLTSDGDHPTPIHAALHSVANYWTVDPLDRGTVEFEYGGFLHRLSRQENWNDS